MPTRNSRVSCSVAASGGTGAFFPSMLTDSRFVKQEFPILMQREALDERQEKRADLNPRDHAKRARTRKIPDAFPCQREFAGPQTGSSGLPPPPGSRREPPWVPGAHNPSTI